MKPRAAAIAVVLIAVALVLDSPALATAQAPPSLLTDQALYTLRDKQVELRGIGYKPSTQYLIWLQTPIESSTHSTGLALNTTDKGEIPAAISLPIEPNSPLGTYLVSISNSTESDTAIARAHYGIWSTDKYVYQRTEVVHARGGGILPKAALKVTIRDPAGTEAFKATVAANETGTFLTTWKIPPNALTEEYTVFVDGTGTYDSPVAEFVSKSKFSVTPAFLNVTVLSQPTGAYERTQTVSADFVVRYPDSTAVVTMKEGLKPVALYAGQFKMAELSLAASGNATGIWTARLKIPRNATLDVKYKFLFPAKAFDDGNGNSGPETDVETGSFSVVPTTLKVSTTLNSTRYQVPFDTMIAYVQVSYPDGTVANATVRAWVSAAGSKANATVTYGKVAAVWIVRYAFSMADLIRPGTWTLSVDARDMYGNSGSTSLEVTAEPYAFLEVVLLVVVAVVVVRWLLSKFWRRLYLGTKRALSAVRGRLKPPSIGRYFNHSPVVP